MLSAIVLAAGLSSRMGIDNKLLLPYKARPVIVSVVETIIAAGIGEVIVVTGHQSDLVRRVLKDFDVRFTCNQRYAEGLTSSIQQGVSLATGNGYMICLSDMVLLTAAEYMLLAAAFEKRNSFDAECICVPRYKNKKGNPVIFSSSYKEAILANTLPEGCKNIVQLNKEHLLLIEMDTPHVLSDFDYPEDYKKFHPGL